MSHDTINKTLLSFFAVFIPLLLFAADPASFTAGHISQEQVISLNFQDIKVRAALQLLAEFSGFNLIVDDKIQGNLSLHLKDIPWQQALDIILHTQGLTKCPIAQGWFIARQCEPLKSDLMQKQQDINILNAKLF